MSYPLYTTPAFVLRAVSVGESSRMLALYTRDLGLVYAKAQGVRKLGSKLRFHLQELGYAEVTLVRGENWRVTSAKSSTELNHYPVRELLYVRRRIFSLLLRLIKGEERHEVLFDSLVQGLLFGEKHPDRLGHVEILLVLVVLYHLGYVGDSALRDLAETPEWSVDLLDKAVALRSSAIKLINASFSELQL